MGGRRSTRIADTTSSSMIQLPEDVIHEILVRVPAKPLRRLRAVCRSWRSLTANPSFIASHTARHGPLIAAITYNPYLDGSRPTHVRLLDASGQIVRQIHLKDYDELYGRAICSNLDLLCGCLVVVDDDDRADKRLCVIDPASSSADNAVSSILPDYDRYNDVSSRDTSFAVGRGFSTGEIKVLGICPKGLGYKVITLGGAGSSSSKRWRQTGGPPVSVDTSQRNVALVKGVLYFMEHSSKNLPQHIAAYDIDEEEWRPDLLRLPAPATGWDMGLVELSGTLVAFYNRRAKDCGSSSMELWFLTDAEKGLWAKRYTISLPVAKLGCGGPFDGSTGQPLCMLGDGRIVFWEWQSSWEDEEWDFELLRVYDPRTNTCTDGVKMVDCAIMGVYNGTLLKSSVDQ